MQSTVRKAKVLLGGDYPTTWGKFIGQVQAKEQLLTATRSAKKRGVRMPHTLLASGTPGIGKTSLALLAAAEMKAGARVVSGKFTMGEARMAFAEMDDGDVLIIDEIHQMVAGGKAGAEWLLNYLQDGVLLTPLGPEQQPSVTIIGATTDSGRLPETVLNRFPCQPLLVAYTETEAAKIALGTAQRIFTELPMPSATNCREIAAAASHNPRVIKGVLEALRDIALVEDGENYNGKAYDITKALLWLGLSRDGLTEGCRRYLLVLLNDFGGRPAGQAAMADRLQEPGGLAYTERLLMDKGYLVKGVGGRVLTSDGVRRARALDAA